MKKSLEISLLYARQSNDAMSDVIRLLVYDGIQIIRTSSNTFEYETEDEEVNQIEYEISENLISAGIPSDEFWFERVKDAE